MNRVGKIKNSEIMNVLETLELMRAQGEKNIALTRIKNDTNGNPRYVCHFLNIAKTYSEAVKLANKIGGRKYHTKSYGGGIAFQSYNVEDLKRSIFEISETR